MESKMVNQTPMSWALSATGLLVSHTNFWASSLISTQLFNKANKGANGKAATNIVINPNCKTESRNWNEIEICQSMLVKEVKWELCKTENRN